MNVDAVVSRPEEVDQSNREIADAASNIEDALFGLKTPTDQLDSRVGARAREDVTIASAVVVNAQMRRREQRIF